MLLTMVKRYLPVWDLRQQQTNNIVLITFWSQFSVYALNTVLILFLTRPLYEHGLGYNHAHAYVFYGVTQATSYLMPIVGGYMADKILGIRRAILLGSILLALSYLLVMLSNYTLPSYGDKFFIIAYALIPATNSLLIGTSSGLVSKIYSDDSVKAKSAMTFYYMAINVGALLATIIAPALLESPYGPLSVLALTFAGKSIAALNFARKYSLYDDVVIGKDKMPMTRKAKYQLLMYLISIYSFTLFAYSHPSIANSILGSACGLGIACFFIKTTRLERITRYKQFIAILLILEAVIFFVIYNQMNSTLIIFAKVNSDLQLFGISVSPAHYQLLNPLLIILLGLQLPRFYRHFPNFSIPYQFASGTLLAGFAMLILVFASLHATAGLVNGNYIGLSYMFITLAELWVSAIGLSMIGLYCDKANLAYAMGVWYLASSLSNTISGSLGKYVAIPEQLNSPLQSLAIFKQYYFAFGIIALLSSLVMFIVAFFIQLQMKKGNMQLA